MVLQRKPLVLLNRNTNVVDLADLTASVDGTPIPFATTTMRLLRGEDEVNGETWPVTMPHVLGTTATYRTILSELLEVFDHERLTAEIIADGGTDLYYQGEFDVLVLPRNVREPLVLLNENTNVIDVLDLEDAIAGLFTSTASGTMTLLRDEVEVDGVVWPLPMAQIDPGLYRVVLSKDLVMFNNEKLGAAIVLDDGAGYHYEGIFDVLVSQRD